MGTEMIVRGAIVDSWLERGRAQEGEPQVVLQVAPQGQPRELLIVEAGVSLLPDRGWLEDLRENMCHGSPVAAVGRLSLDGQLRATHLELAR